MRVVEQSLCLIQRETRAYDVKLTAKRINGMSRSNGCLMRIAPMAVWMAEHVYSRDGISYENMKALVKSDVELTHSDKLPQ